MPSYTEYLRIDELLALQCPLSEGPEHDEMLFIVIHQVYELWFKEILHELDHLNQLLAGNDGAHARQTLKRVLTILKVMVAQIDILETLTPIEFLSFRDRLESGSGFQSFQFRELEFALGWKHPGALDRYPAGSEARRRLVRVLQRWEICRKAYPESGGAYAERSIRELVGDGLLNWFYLDPLSLRTAPDSLAFGYEAAGELQRLRAFSADWDVTDIALAPTRININGGGSRAGAICMRYKDGVLTDEPLWPWPMNQRILDARRQSGRPPIDVTSLAERILGSIPSPCRG